MNAIVFIGSHTFGTSFDALTVAKEMGYSVILFTNKKHHTEYSFPTVDHLIFINDPFDREQILKPLSRLQIEGIKICACISFIDPFVSFAAELAIELGLSSMSAQSLKRMENKICVREKLKDLPTSPFYAVLEKNTSIESFYEANQPLFPCILKPPISNGSKHIQFIDTIRKWKMGTKLLRKRYPDLPILVEEFISGPQYLIEVIVYDHEVKIVGVIEQETASDHSFIMIGYQYPAILVDDDYVNLLQSVEEIIEQLELANGGCHLEMKLSDGKWKLIEINPRMSGGMMNEIIEKGTGINLIKEVLTLHLGEQPMLEKKEKQSVYAKYITVRSPGTLLRVTGQDKALMHEGVSGVYIKPLNGNILIPPSSMGHRYACIIATAISPDKAKQIALLAAKEIKFYLEPL
ncbi:ATP-grasp domain-containing protein [Bacillus sp. FJAT-50079]|uniref:ATP-grasp domain-containing protein n=1 Tax=Bacillus sp. FJAT-50079 TaxID=2833577 RepID=UPI001BC9AEE7|nr:ATP-grasp domain-containing protein [Bacillus sp. FJAT-50079]MBS4206946.1 ATP-grasp domain-containing protein [Bacillus sp. FJAT-50079]